MSPDRSAFDVLMSKSQSHWPKRSKIGETVNAELAKTLVPISRVAQLKSKNGLLKKNPGDFDPEKVSCWEKGERVPLMFLSLAFDMISIESGRIVITDILCNMLRTIIATTPEDLLPTVYLAANEIAPAHEGVKLGIGKGSSIIKAIAEAFGRTESQVEQQDTAAKIVKEVFSVLPVYDIIVGALLSSVVWNLPKTCNFTPGVPVRPMLAKATTSVGAILDKFQIHYMEDGTFEIFSRNAERNTGKYPDVALALSRLKKPSVKSFILDCEVVAFDRENKKIIPFQTLSTRAHKNVNVCDIKVGVCIFAFDMLYLNGQLLIQENLNIRREKLYDSFEEDPGYFQFATSLTSSNIGEIQEFLKASVDMGCEGLMIKTLYSDATYEPSKRSNNWLKLKKDYMDSIGDSVDLVPIAAFHGRGKRTGFFGAFLLACYDVDKEEFQSICNIGTGFSEAELQELSSSLCSKVIATPKQYYRVDDSLNPDVWFEPTEVGLCLPCTNIHRCGK